MNERKTLPAWVAAWGGMPSLDVVRAVVRKTPELRSLGERFGPVLTYSPDEARAIREAIEVREAAKAGRQRPVAATA